MDAAQLDLISIDGRLDAVEPKVTTLESEMDAAQSSISTLQSDVAAIENSVGQAGGLVPLNGSSLIDAQYLPSYVDDVLEFANLAGFPAIGETAKIYVALDNSKCYRWSGSQYIEISASEVNSVNTKTGVVVLNASDILMVSEVKSIEQKLVDLSAADVALDGRLDTAESNITSLQSDMTQAQSDIVSLGSDITDLEAYADSIQSEVDDLEAFSGGNSEDIDALNASVAALESSVSAIDIRVQALESEKHYVPHSMSVSIASASQQASIDLSHIAVTATLNVHVDAMKAHHLRDFSVSEVGGVTRITWINTFAIGGIEEVAIGETAYISYSYEV
jgi:predicted  nucleic acid-binding Zn-ribbon protein